MKTIKRWRKGPVVVEARISEFTDGWVVSVYIPRVTIGWACAAEGGWGGIQAALAAAEAFLASLDAPVTVEEGE